MPTIIQNIPEELLLIIFNNLSGRDLIQCEHVCRSWYIPARVKYLNRRVVLKNNSRIKRFITAINRNPNPRFLAAVKGIQTWTTKSTKNLLPPINVLWDCLPRFIHEVFQRPTKEKVFQLRMNTVLSDIFIETDENTTMMITVMDYQLKQRTSLFDGTLEMDTFELKMPFNHSRTYTHTYDAFFRTKSTFKEVIFHVPDKVLGGEEPIEDEVARNHTSVEKLTIISAAFATVEFLIERCPVAFPNLKILILDRFFGYWLKKVPKYKLELGRYTLEKLVLYLTPLYLENQKRKAVVIDVEVLSLCDRHLYKIPVDGSEPTRIDDPDLIGVVRGEDYVLVHLVVGSLRYLKIVSEVNTRPSMKLETKLDIELESSKISNDE